MSVSSEVVPSHGGTRELSPGSGDGAEEGVQVLRICSSCHETRNQVGYTQFLTKLSKPSSLFHQAQKRSCSGNNLDMGRTLRVVGKVHTHTQVAIPPGRSSSVRFTGNKEQKEHEACSPHPCQRAALCWQVAEHFG